MINAYHKQLSLESYAQEALAGTWMELVDGPDPFPEPDFLQDPNLSYRDRNPGGEEQFFHDDCSECGGPPPPIFDIPPPPPPPIFEEDEESSSETAHLIYVGDQIRPRSERKLSYNEESKSKMDWKSSISARRNCEETLLPQDICPAFLIAGDAHVRPRLQPPIAALIVAATTFAFVIAIAAIVCWRYRRHKNRGGSSKSTTDLANGVIYEDLPSGPPPRGLSTQGHDTRTLAPMELLDLKLANQLHNSSYAGSDSVQRSLLNPYSTSSVISPSNIVYSQYPKAPYSQDSSVPKEFNIYENSQKTMYSDYPFHATTGDPVFTDYPFNHGGGQKGVPVQGEFIYNSKDYNVPYSAECQGVLVSNPYTPDRQIVASTNSDVMYSSEDSPRELDSENSRTSFLNRYQDLMTESNPPKKMSFKDSQDIYNPTYEEISTGSESTVSSRSSVGRGSGAQSLHEGEGPIMLHDASWSSGPCPCSSGRRSKSNRGRRHKTLVEENDYQENPIEPLAPPPIPAPALYTIPGTSDGRTSTSSSSDLPPDRSCASREPRYYVGSSKDECLPYLTTQHHRSHDGCRSQPGTFLPTKDKLPPLPSRSDRYRIFFTTDRRRNSPSQDAKTLDLASRKRNRDKDKQSSVESEPLYHEL